MMRNPIFESSAKRQMRTWRTPLLVTLYVLFLLVVIGASLSVLLKDSVTLGNLRAGLEGYIYLSVMQFALIVLVAPALTSSAISGERERQTLDLLLCTRVGSLRIVLGKLLSNVCFLALLIVSSLPAMSVTLLFGGVRLLDMLRMQLFLFVVAVTCCAIGIFCSALFKRTVTATVVSYLILFAIGVGTLVFQLDDLQQLSYGASSVYIGGSGGGAVSMVSMVAAGGVTGVDGTVSALPLALYINPAVGFLSMLVQQTGLLRNTLENSIGYYGDSLFSLMSRINGLAGVNMIVMLAVSAILTPLAALFVKPSGRRARKHK